MATNEILPFAQGGSALVLTQAAYNSDSQRTIGHQPGVARPDFANKQARQASVLAAGLAQFLADNQVTNITDLLTPVALSTIITNAIKAATLMPAGAIIWIPGLVVPAGTLKLNGALLSRTTYARLWAYANSSGNVSASDAVWSAGNEGHFSPGDGSTTFRVPDLRGYFMRAWDDGRGMDASRVIGSTQTDQNLSHNHGTTEAAHSHTANVTDPQHDHNVPHSTDSSSAGNGISGSSHTDPQTWLTNLSSTGITVSIGSNSTGLSVNAAGGSEVRVKNMALMPVIFY